MLRVDVEGLEETVLKLKSWSGAATLNKVFGPAMVQMQIELQRYPAERPGQKYTRTNKLKGGWRITRGANGVMSLANPVPYAPFVQGVQQSWMHQGRWTTTTALTAKYRPMIMDAIHKEIKDWADS